MNVLEEKQLSRKEIYDGKVLHVVVDRVELPNGASAIREYCLHPGAVAVLPLTADGFVVMERQYRYPHRRVFFEIPAGKLEKNDPDILTAAKRELREETGAVAERFTDLGVIDTTPALIDERIHLYLAEGLTFGERELDEDEFLNTELVPIADLYEMVMRGEIKDAKTVVAILKTHELLQRRR